ncbi:hypothetical protein B0H14DRAFT_2567102 [Mycena olivaceomarginata]|nr:hypothetical protein B0H14DRAFT_2567102 [Mycena olivaceomarginata]
MYTSSAQNIPCTVLAYRGSATTALKRIVLKTDFTYGDMDYTGKTAEKERIFGCNQRRVLDPKPGPREIGDTQVYFLGEVIIKATAPIYCPTWVYVFPSFVHESRYWAIDNKGKMRVDSGR